MLQSYALLGFFATDKTCLITSVSEHSVFFVKKYQKSGENDVGKSSEWGSLGVIADS